MTGLVLENEEEERVLRNCMEGKKREGKLVLLNNFHDDPVEAVAVML